MSSRPSPVEAGGVDLDSGAVKHENPAATASASNPVEGSVDPGEREMGDGSDGGVEAEGVQGVGSVGGEKVGVADVCDSVVEIREKGGCCEEGNDQKLEMRIDEVASLPVADGEFETESSDSMPNQGRVPNEAAENSDERELIKEGDQKLEINVVEPRSTLEAAEATTDADLEGFQAGNLDQSMLNPVGLQVESVDVSHGGEVSDAVGGFETESSESMPNQVRVQGEAAEIIDDSELIKEGDQKLDITVAEAGSKTWVAEASIDVDMEGFQTGSLMGVPNLGGVPIESVDISHRGEINVANGGFEPESSESMPNQGRLQGEAVVISDSSDHISDGGLKLDITVVEVGSLVGAAKATIDPALNGFQAGSLVGVPKPGEVCIEPVDISHEGEVSVSVEGYGTYNLESSPNQGRVQAKAAEISDDSELVKDGDQKPDKTVPEAGSMVGIVEVPLDAALQRFKAGSVVGAPNPEEAPVESADISHGTKVGVAVGGFETESLASMLNQGRVQGEAVEISDESEHIKEGDQKQGITVAEVGNTVWAAEATIDPVLKGFQAGSLVSVPNPGEVCVESVNINHGGETSVAVGGFETESFESMPIQGQVQGKAAETSGESEFIKDGDQKPDITVVEAGSMLGAAEETIDAALEGFQAESFVGMPNPGGVQVESVDISHGGEINDAARGFEPESLESTLNQGRLWNEAAEITEGSVLIKEGDQRPDIVVAEVGNAVGAAEATVDAAPERFQDGSLTEPNPEGLLVHSVNIGTGPEVSVTIGGFEHEKSKSMSNQGRVQGEAAEVSDGSELINEGYQKPDIDVAVAGMGATEVTVDPSLEGFQSGSLVVLQNSGGVRVESTDIMDVAEVSVAVGRFENESSESMPNQGRVWGEDAEFIESKLRKEGDLNPMGASEAIIDAALEGFQAGSLVEVPNPGGFRVDTVNINQGAEVRAEGISCNDENRNTNSAISHDLLSGHVEISVSIPDDKGWEAEDGSVGDQKSETEVVEMESMGGTARTPDVAVGGVDSEGLEDEPNLGAQDEVAEICNETEHAEEGVSCLDKNQSSVKDMTGHDLLDGQLQVTEGVLGHGDNGQNQSELVVDFTAGAQNLSEGLSLGINQESEAQAMIGKTEVGDGSMLDGDRDKYCKYSASQASLMDTNLRIRVEGDIVSEKGLQKLVPMPFDDATADVANDVLKNPDLVDPVEVQNLDAHQLDNKWMNTGDFVTSGSETIISSPAFEAESVDGRFVNDDSMGTGDFLKADVGSAKVVVNVEAQNAETDPVDENTNIGDICMAGADSVLGVLVVESQSRDTYLIDENPDDKGDILLVSSCLGKETQAANTCQLHENFIEKDYFVMQNPIPVVETSILKTSEMSEIRTIVSQGKGSVDVFGGNQEMSSLANGDPIANTHDVESSPGRGRMDMESNVLMEVYSPPVDCFQEVEVFEGSKTKLQAPSLGDSVADLVMDASSVLIEEQELLERAEEQTLKFVAVTPWTSSMENNQFAHYYLPPPDTPKFSISDLVWGKVKSHPWWPGQIFDPSDASEMALKHQRKDNFLVAYYGDRTFAWCDESQLKPFQAYFSQMEKQSSSELFVNSVNDILGEVSRRVELGMTCFCLPEEYCANIRYQKVENAGIREGCDTSFFDRSLIVNSFQPGKLREYLKALAQFPTGGADRLELVIAKAQLKTFYHSKGYPELPKFIVGGGLMENDVEILPFTDKEPAKQTVEHSTPTSSGIISGKRKSRGRPSSKQKFIMEDALKQKSLSELKEEKNVSCLANGGKSASGIKASELPNLCSGKKHKVVDSDSADSGMKKKKLDLLGDLESPSLTLTSSFKVEECIEDSGESKKKRQDTLGDLGTKSPFPNLSFKIGDCIRRVASQLTGSPPILKSHGERFHQNASKADHRRAHVGGIDDFSYDPVQSCRTKTTISVDYSSPDEMISQLCLAAKDPMKGYNFLSLVISFFTDFRNFCASDFSNESTQNDKTGHKRGRKKTVKETVDSQSPSSDISTPDHMKDSYWCDVAFHNSSEKRLISNGPKRETGVRSKKKRKSAGQPSSSLSLGPIMETALQLQVGAVSSSIKHALAAERSIISVEEKLVDTPTALVLSFSSSDSLPSETNLIRIFGRYGPLKEAETEVLRKSNRVKVVFKRRADAEIAFSSAGKFSIFGPSLVSYQLKYLPSTPKTSPCTSPQGKSDAAPTEFGSLEVSVQAETGLVSDTTQVEAVGKG